jgi:hypothetical protein
MKLISIRRNIIHTQCKNCLLCIHIRYTVFYILSPWKYRTFKISLFTERLEYEFYSNKKVSFEIHNRRLEK